MSVAIITGSCGLIGSEAVSFFSDLGFDVVGIDNNLREHFFGKDGSVTWNQERLFRRNKRYIHYSVDIRDQEEVSKIFGKFHKDTALVIHAAAQPSHDWAARDPMMDFEVNTAGTMVMLEATRKHSPKAVFIFTSTNKVYGDRPNSLPFIELEKRFELPQAHQYYEGIDESMSIDNCLHSLFGASKVSADIYSQEYGKYFGIRTGIFRGGCLTGPAHSGAQLHGFLSYLVKCCLTKKTYTIFGYKGKQVRDNIHSYDLINAFFCFFQNPRCGEVYNIGGGRFANLSILEAIEICEDVTGEKLDCEYVKQNRVGDHIWWVSDVFKFKSHYPEWDYKYNIRDTVREIVEVQKKIL